MTASSTAGVVAAGGSRATASGVAILEAGGNAADAAAATIFALVVTDPSLFSLGCEVPILVHQASTRSTLALSGQGEAPRSAAAAAWYAQHGIPKSGLRASPVPAAPSAVLALLSGYGTKTLAEVVAPTLVLLDEGKQPWHAKLARTLRRMTKAEADAGPDRLRGIAAARALFYEGAIADELAAAYAAQGGFLTKEDLRAHRTQIEAPVAATFAGVTVVKCGPWTQGPACLQALRLIERVDPGPVASAQWYHVHAEAIKLAFADRDHWYGDPNFVQVPMTALLGNAYSDLRAKLITDRAADHARPGDPQGLRPLLSAIARDEAWQPGTTTCCVVDRWGNAVAATPSGNNPYEVGDLGVRHATRLSSLNTTAGHPNQYAPGKRPRITLTPTLILRSGACVGAISVAGGDMQDQAAVQVLSALYLRGQGPSAALDLPRIGSEIHEDSFDPQPVRAKAIVGRHLIFDARIPAQVVAELTGKGHATMQADASKFGRVSLIVIDPATLVATAAGRAEEHRSVGAARR